MNPGIYLIVVALIIGVVLALVDVEARIKKAVVVGAVIIAVLGIIFIVLGLVGRLGV